MHTIKKEVIKSLLFRISGMGFGFITTALLIRHLGSANYGTWATLTSLLAWIQLSDFGVGYALKNRIASNNDANKLLPLVSGVFQFYLLLSVIIALLFVLFGNYLAIVKEYKYEAFILYIGTIMFFPLSIGSAILQGLRKNSVTTLIGLVQSLFWLISVFFLTQSNPNLLLLSLVFISVSLLISVMQCIIGVRSLMKKEHSSLKLLFAFSNIRLAFPLWKIGIRFILLQLSGVVLFSLGTYLTYSNLSPEDAAKYDVLFKFFQLPLTFFNIIISVYWVEIANAIGMNDRGSLVKKFTQLHLMALSVALIMLVFTLFIATPVIEIYASKKIHITTNDTLSFWILITIQIFAYAGAVFLNATEKLKGQVIFAVLAALLLIPCVMLLYAKGWGFTAVPIATALLISPSLIYCNWTAYHHVIKKTSKIPA
jgi:O-antigen/teichoic acid export membrane protein